MSTEAPPNNPPAEHAATPLVRGATIGRYVVLGLVGRGGMGEVYAAYDPELDRKVAVKLLRVKPGNGVSLNEGRQRTLREAQAIARLSHPNVVVVYDVGTFRDQVFIAMEFVEGNTVTYWLAAQPRSWQEVLRVFRAAGRGLTAAHEKGLVHRDFKPDNVMVGRDGEVRVMDFGLARQVADKPAPEGTPPARRAPVVIAEHGPSSGNDDDQMTTILLNGPPSGPPTPAPGTESQPGSGMFEVQLTRTGAMMGTPAYMAPEQFLGTATDARTDQFSFCVALYEALYGERPFSGNTMFALTTAVVQGQVKEAPQSSKVPLWVRKVLLRGLRAPADERYPSMHDLIDALGKNPNAARMRFLAVAAVVLVPVALTVGVHQSLANHKSICGAGPARLAGVWDLTATGEPEPARQAAIHSAFLHTGKSYANEVYATVNRILSGYSQSWAKMYREACEATNARGEQSAEVLDLRMTCLQERLGGLRALTDVFSDANGQVVENAVSAANNLGSLDRCADVPLLRSVVRPPEDPEDAGPGGGASSAARRRQGALRLGPVPRGAQGRAGADRRGARARVSAAHRRDAVRDGDDVQQVERRAGGRAGAGRFLPGRRRLPRRRGAGRGRHQSGLGRRLSGGALRRCPAVGEVRRRDPAATRRARSLAGLAGSTTWEGCSRSGARGRRRCGCSSRGWRSRRGRSDAITPTWGSRKGTWRSS